MPEYELGLTEAEFWSAPLRTGQDLARRLKDDGFSGVRLYGPAIVPLDLRETLPLITFRVASFREEFRLSFAEHAVIVMVDVERRRVLAGFAVEQNFERFAQDVDPAEIADGMTAQQNVLDLREHFRLDWRPATYLICVVMRDYVSNRIRIRLQRSERAYVDPEAEQFKAAERRKLPLPAIWPPPAPGPDAETRLPDYRRRADSPALPDGMGVVLAMDRVAVARPGAQLLLRGSFRVPASAGLVVGRDAGQGHPIPQAVAGRVPTFLLPITLLLTGSERPAPSVWRLFVPSFDEIPEGGDAPVTGYFTFDMLAAEDLARPLQSYFVYWFCGELMGGPSRITLLGPDDIE